tara:strand:- start:56275 stop:57342 length:1068 start_codon:yes stop_codon:yes gene_type:complete
MSFAPVQLPKGSSTLKGSDPDRPFRATSYDVAKAAGVAQSTVSRCFQKGSNISTETRARVQRIATELGYSRNALARSLITKKSNMVGVIATRFTIRNNPELVYTLGEALRRKNRRMLLMTIENDATVGSIIDEALEYPLDGLICCSNMDEPDIARFRGRGVPIVFFNRDVTSARTDSIATDHAEAGRQAAALLFEAGHRRIICIKGPEQAQVSRMRVDAFVARLAELGVKHVPTQSTDFSYDQGLTAFVDLVKDMTRPDAVFCANDQLALGVMDACRYTLGWHVPDDISVVGFDDIAEASHLSYDLTTIQQPILEMALHAVELLIARAANPDVGESNIRLAGRLIERSSARIQVK